MKYFKNEFTGEVFGFEDDGSQDDFIPSGLQEMTGQQVYDHLHPDQSLSREDIERMRQICYSDPVTGSDRHYLEAARERASSNFEAAKAAEEKGNLRYAEIKGSLPFPEQKM